MIFSHFGKYWMKGKPEIMDSRRLPNEKKYTDVKYKVAVYTE